MSDIKLLKAPVFPTEIRMENEWLERRDKVLAAAKKINEVISQDDFDDAEVSLSRVSKLSTDADKIRKSFVKPFNDFVKQINGMTKEVLAELMDVKAFLKSEMSAFVRRVEEENQRQLEESASAVAQSAFADQAPDMNIQEQHVSRSMSSVRKTWTFEIIDKEKMPKEFLMPDEVKIRKFVMANKENGFIDGVRIYQETSVQSR